MKGEGLWICCICSPQSPAVCCSLGNNILRKKRSKIMIKQSHWQIHTTHTQWLFMQILKWVLHSHHHQFFLHIFLEWFVVHHNCFICTFNHRCMQPKCENEYKSYNTALCWQKSRMITTSHWEKYYTLLNKNCCVKLEPTNIVFFRHQSVKTSGVSSKIIICNTWVTAPAHMCPRLFIITYQS